jgi:hypothetical protein
MSDAGLPEGSDALLERLADKLLARMTGSDVVADKRQKRATWSNQLPTKRNLGLQLITALGMSGILVVGGWWLWVRDGISNAATRDYAVDASKAAVDTHELLGEHPKLEKRMVNVELEQRTIRESQIRQEVTAEATAETLKIIQADVKKLSRQRH